MNDMFPLVSFYGQLFQLASIPKVTLTYRGNDEAGALDSAISETLQASGTSACVSESIEGWRGITVRDGPGVRSGETHKVSLAITIP